MQLKMRKALSNPPRVLMLGFLLLIVVGAALLSLPAASTQEPLGGLDALFTATSAVCVTGLSVIDIGRDLTFFGQVVLILLIQMGGLGFMTLSTLVLVLMGRRITLRERLIIQNSLNEEGLQGLVALTMRIVLMTLCFEGVGALLLLTRMVPLFGLADGIWYSVFHSISAFCNAGFDLVGGFVEFQNDPVILLSTCALISVGGIGFGVILDIRRNGRNFKRFALHTKVVLLTSLLLTLGGMAAFLFLEWGNPGTLAHPDLHPLMRPVAAFFQSVTCRTAGFNTLDQSKLTEPSAVLTMLLMFIGASPASTGGGIKTTTFGVFILLMINVLRGREKIVVFGRTISQQLVNRSVVLLTLAAILIVLAHMGLTLVLPMGEAVTSSHVMYEVISAFGTVGLSIGVTSALTPPAKLIMILVMYVGRVGLLTLAVALTKKAGRGETRMDYPEGKIMIG